MSTHLASQGSQPEDPDLDMPARDVAYPIVVDLVHREREALAKIAAGAPLPSVLDELLRAIEDQADSEMLTSVLLVSEDGKHLLSAAAPRLPTVYSRAIDGFAVGEGNGSCGTAAARGAPVYVSDIANDPLWAQFGALAVSLGLRACWSTPIAATDGRILGTFAIYYRETRAPMPADLATIAYIAQTVALAIERHRSDTRLMQAQKELRSLNELLAKQVTAQTVERDRLWSLSRDPFLIADLDGTWRSISPAWCELLGWSEADLIGRTSEWLEHPDEAGRIGAEIAKLIGGARVGRFDSRFRTRAGAYLIFSWTVATDRDLLYCVARNVTDEREREQELSRAQELLRQAQKMEAIGQLTGGVAHDFNNLLTVIQGAVDLLRREDITPERRNRYISAIADTTGRATRLTSQLLAFARRQTLRPETFDVSIRLDAVAQMLDAMSGARIGIEITKRCAGCFVRADLSQFETALVNLVVNARDAMQGVGSIAITLECGAFHGREGYSDGTEYVAVTVADTGEGIAAENLSRIFEPFYTTKEVGKGTGLGLSQVFGFAKQSGGDLTVESEIGRGTQVSIWLPRVAADAEAIDVEILIDETIDDRDRRVLVVEDDADVGRFATELLQAKGFLATLVSNAEAGLALVEADIPFDVVFSDVMMAGIGGLEFAKRVRTIRPDLPIVLASGYSETLVTEQRQRIPLLQKPYSATQLVTALRRAIGSAKPAA